MSGPIKWRYGCRYSTGRWLWPRGLWEYDVEDAKAAALRTWPYASIVGVEPMTLAEGIVRRWIHERGKGWQRDFTVAPTVELSSKVPANAWWLDRD